MWTAENSARLRCNAQANLLPCTRRLGLLPYAVILSFSLLSIGRFAMLPDAEHSNMTLTILTLCRLCKRLPMLLYYGLLLLWGADPLPPCPTSHMASIKRLLWSDWAAGQLQLRRALQLSHAGQSAQLRVGPCAFGWNDFGFSTRICHGPVHCASL